VFFARAQRTFNNHHSIVAIHGLDDRRVESWTHENGVCWLKDDGFLPTEFPNARIIAFGYDANTAAKEISTGQIEDHGESLINGLAQLRLRTSVCFYPYRQTGNAEQRTNRRLIGPSSFLLIV
jgi:hypothetical protein